LVLVFSLFFVGAVSFDFSSPSETEEDNVNINLDFFSVDGLLDFVFKWGASNYSVYDEDLILMMDFNNNSDLGENDSLVRDLSRYGHNGSVLGGASVTSEGKYGKAYNFNEGEGINISAHEDFNVDEFTISLWVKKGEGTNFKDYFMGAYFTCGLLENGSAMCWGDNTYGQIGNGDVGTNVYFPSLVETDFVIEEFAQTSPSHVRTICGLLENGSAVCWGDNEFGELGNGTLGGYAVYPQLVSGNHSFSQLAMGETHVCGLLENGTALCWGENLQGELGLGNYTQFSYPVFVNTSFNFTQITGGDHNTCGLLENGSALCWGRNDHGQLGDNTTTQRNLPVFVKGGYEFSYLYNANDFVCGILTNGSAVCWGTDLFSSIGDNLVGDQHMPSFIYGDYEYQNISCAYTGCCGILTNGSAVCWGRNREGELGISDTSVKESNFPVFVKIDKEFENIYTGIGPSCAESENELFCWGEAGKGELSSGIFALEEFPNYLSYDFDFLELGAFSSCSLLQNGSAMCWGWNIRGQLGINSTENKDFPTFVYENNTFKEVSISGFTACGLLQNGSAMCWGRNDYGQLGDNTTTERHVPTFVYGNYSFSNISVGAYFVCGLLENGSAICWGANNYGQLGNNNLGIDSKIPVYVQSNYLFNSLNLGFSHACGLLENGSALCWGWNNYGQLGCNSTEDKDSPTFVYGNYSFVSIHSSALSSCGLLENGSVMCWGDNTYGQLGEGGFVSNSSIPVFVKSNYLFDSLNSGFRHVCGLLQNGSAMCWGDNQENQIIYSSQSSYYSPIFSHSKNNFSLISTGYLHTCGILNDGRSFCWGSNNYGQLGIPASINKKPLSAVRDVFFGKSQYLYRIYHTFGGNLKFMVENNEMYIPLENDWTNLAFSYKDGVQKVYINGELNETFDSGAIFDDRYWDVLLGKNFNGQIDDLMMWNRSLSDEEIEFIYKSNLDKVNETSWSFKTSFSDLAEATYNYGVYVRDSFGWVNSLRNLIVDFPDEETPHHGGSYIPQLPSKKHSWFKLEAGEGGRTTEFDFEFGIKDISVKVKNTVENAGVTVIKHNETSFGNKAKEGKVYQYLEINSENLDENLESAVINFRVEKSWLENNSLGIEEISISKYNEESESWKELETNYNGSDEEYHYYVVEVQGFSLFAISEKVLVEPENSQNEGPENNREVEKTEQEKSYWYLWVLGIVVIGLIVWFVVKKNKNSKKLK
jgi:PGF-pre-PGF domain-containing protein